MTNHSIKGVVAAIITPIRASGSPDTAKFLKLARHLLDEGCEGLNILGTTGEATSFTAAQRLSLMQSVADSGLPMERLLVGTGAAAVGDACSLTSAAAELSFSGALVLPPFYYKDPGRDGIVSYYRQIAVALRRPFPIYLYNFPRMSGINFDLELIEKIVRESGLMIAGLKDSSGDPNYARSVVRSFPHLDVFPSSEARLDAVRRGEFAGCISATANITSALCAQALHSMDDDALVAATKIRELFDGMPLVPAIKAVLAHRLADPAIAATLPPLGKPNAQSISRLIDQWELLQP